MAGSYMRSNCYEPTQFVPRPIPNLFSPAVQTAVLSQHGSYGPHAIWLLLVEKRSSEKSEMVVFGRIVLEGFVNDGLNIQAILRHAGGGSLNEAERVCSCQVSSSDYSIPGSMLKVRCGKEVDADARLLPRAKAARATSSEGSGNDDGATTSQSTYTSYNSARAGRGCGPLGSIPSRRVCILGLIVYL